MEKGPEQFDFPCSPAWRSYYNERYGYSGIDYLPYPRASQPSQENIPNERLEALERKVNHLYALSAMRQLELTELARHKTHKPRY